MVMWAESPNGPRTQGLGPGPKGRSQGPGPFFKITLLFGANCSVLDFCCIVGCKTSGFDGLVVLKIYSYGHVDRKPQWSRTQGLDQKEGPRAQGPGLFFFNHSSFWGELFCVGFLLHSRVQNFEVRRYGHVDRKPQWSRT